MMVSLEKPGSPQELVHHGIKGMKWGVRRSVNTSGQTTSTSKKPMSTKKKVAIGVGIAVVVVTGAIVTGLLLKKYGKLPTKAFTHPEPFKHPKAFTHPEPFKHPKAFVHPDSFTHPESFKHPKAFTHPEPFKHPKAFSHPKAAARGRSVVKQILRVHKNVPAPDAKLLADHQEDLRRLAAEADWSKDWVAIAKQNNPGVFK